MQNPSTTKMSSKGQVVIPEEIRHRLNLETGAQFVVLGNKDVVILKKIEAPALSEFEGLIKQARSAAKKAGLTQEDINQAVRQSRTKK